MDKQDRMTQANEDYLEAIYELAGEVNKPVRSVDVASMLDVSKASVNKAVSILKECGYIKQEPYDDIYLTQKGMDYGKSVFKRHRVLHHFLMDVLGVEDKIAEEEACKMEHAISDDTLNRWITYMEETSPMAVKAAKID